MNEDQLKGYNDLPRPRSYRLVDFERVEIVTLETFPPQYVLVVRGEKPYLNMRVELVPLLYIQQPEYWGIEVVGHLRGGIWLPAMAPYTASIPLIGIMGKRGIEVIGATRSESIDIPPQGAVLGECSDWNAWHDHEPPGPARLNVHGECKFPTAGYTVELRRNDPQGINPKDLLLTRIVHEPSGPVAQVETVVEVRYQEETDFEYDTVTILPDGPSVPIQEVS